MKGYCLLLWGFICSFLGGFAQNIVYTDLSPGSQPDAYITILYSSEIQSGYTSINLPVIPHEEANEMSQTLDKICLEQKVFFVLANPTYDQTQVNNLANTLSQSWDFKEKHPQNVLLVLSDQRHALILGNDIENALVRQKTANLQRLGNNIEKEHTRNFPNQNYRFLFTIAQKIQDFVHQLKLVQNNAHQKLLDLRADPLKHYETTLFLNLSDKITPQKTAYIEHILQDFQKQGYTFRVIFSDNDASDLQNKLKDLTEFYKKQHSLIACIHSRYNSTTKAIELSKTSDLNPTFSGMEDKFLMIAYNYYNINLFYEGTKEYIEAVIQEIKEGTMRKAGVEITENAKISAQEINKDYTTAVAHKLYFWIVVAFIFTTLSVVRPYYKHKLPERFKPAGFIIIPYLILSWLACKLLAQTMPWFRVDHLVIPYGIFSFLLMCVMCTLSYLIVSRFNKEITIKIQTAFLIITSGIYAFAYPTMFANNYSAMDEEVYDKMYMVSLSSAAYFSIFWWIIIIILAMTVFNSKNKTVNNQLSLERSSTTTKLNGISKRKGFGSIGAN